MCSCVALPTMGWVRTGELGPVRGMQAWGLDRYVVQATHSKGIGHRMTEMLVAEAALALPTQER